MLLDCYKCVLDGCYGIARLLTGCFGGVIQFNMVSRVLLGCC